MRRTVGERYLTGAFLGKDANHAQTLIYLHQPDLMGRCSICQKTDAVVMMPIPDMHEYQCAMS